MEYFLQNVPEFRLSWNITKDIHTNEQFSLIDGLTECWSKIMFKMAKLNLRQVVEHQMRPLINNKLVTDSADTLKNWEYKILCNSSRL